MTDQKRLCRRCLLSDMPDEAALAQNIQELIALLPEDERAAQAETQRRLAACRACGRLQSGLCALCGCYVELRAAKRRMRCPDVPSRW